MSFINSVISSLNDGKPIVSVPPVRPVKATSSTASNEPLTGNGTLSIKRKAEDDLGKSQSKATRYDASRSVSNTSKFKYDSSSKSQVPERFKTGIQKVEPSRKPEIVSSSAVTATPKPLSKPSNPARSESTLASSKAPPKKGSYAEILARASQNKAPAPVGQITNKKEKLSAKKELALQKELASQRKKKGGPDRAVLSGLSAKKSGTALDKSVVNSTASKTTSKATAYQGTSRGKAPTTYQGTMKNKPQVAYQGTMKPGMRAQKTKNYDSEPERNAKRPSQNTNRRGYRSEEESEEDESDDGYDYASEDYSDMDAGFDDVEDEDEEAARIAKKEDAFEQKMLDELKRQKEERKRRALAGKEKERMMR